MSGSHQLRRKRFYENLNAGEALILFAGSAPGKTADARYPFFANRNFFYLTGILQANSVFMAVNRDGGIEETLFIHPKDPMKERWHGYRISPEEASEHSGIDNIMDLEKSDEILNGMLESGSVSSLWYDFDRFDEGRGDAPIYIEDKNIGFRIEDNVAITETGYEHLSWDIVREIEDIEAMMS